MNAILIRYLHTSIKRRDLCYSPKIIDTKKLKVAISYDLGFAPMSNLCRTTFDKKLDLIKNFFGKN